MYYLYNKKVGVGNDTTFLWKGPIVNSTLIETSLVVQMEQNWPCYISHLMVTGHQEAASSAGHETGNPAPTSAGDQLSCSECVSLRSRRWSPEADEADMGHGTRELKVLWRSQRGTRCKLVHLPYFWSLVKKKRKLLNTAVPRSITFVASTFPLAENAQSSYSCGRPGGLGPEETILLLTGTGFGRTEHPAPVGQGLLLPPL